RARKVAVTVDADDTLLASIIEALKPDMLQLHGHETPQRVAAVRESFGLPVMKALPIEAKSDLLAIGSYTGAADRLLFDARPPRDATRPGGLVAVKLQHVGLERLDNACEQRVVGIDGDRDLARPPLHAARKRARLIERHVARARWEEDEANHVGARRERDIKRLGGGKAADFDR